MSKLIKYIFLTLLITNFELSSYARAGGAGGDDDNDDGGSSSSSSSSDYSSSSSSDDDDYSSSSSSSSSGGGASNGKLNTIIILTIFSSIIIYSIIDSRREKAKIAQRAPDAPKKFDFSEGFLNANTSFNEKDFKERVEIAFMEIQHAWQNQNLGKVRKWISDGIYQRFNLQINMMQQLKQINKLSNIKILNINIVKAEKNGSYSQITALIKFKMDDEFISDLMPELNQSFDDSTASEYWTFIKKSGPIKSNLYTSDNCPNCSTPLTENAGEVSRCSSCGTVTYLGDYDWVLADITQKNDYGMDNLSIDYSSPLIKTLKEEEDLSLQNMEDKAANAFVHFLVAKAKANKMFLNRFATDDFMNKLDVSKPHLYNRLYLSRITCKEYHQNETNHFLKFKIVYGAQKVELNNNSISKIDKDVITKTVDLTLSRKKGPSHNKAKLWSYDCNSCGAPIKDTTSNICSYCGDKLNSGELNWIVTEIKEA